MWPASIPPIVCGSERFGKGGHMPVLEAAPTVEIVETAIDTFKHTVTSELEARVEAKTRMIDQIRLVNAPVRALIQQDAKARSAISALAPMVETERARFKKTATTKISTNEFKTLSLTTHGGLSVSVPPYDFQWTSSVFDDADKNAGTFAAHTIDSLGYQAAGIGLFLSTTVAEDVRFSADAEFHAQWTDLVIEGVAATDGGVGVLVYEGGNTIARTDAQLWDDFQSGHSIVSNSGDTVTYLTQTSAADTYFHMEPGRKYQAWVWCWTTATVLGNDLAVSSIQAKMPFVVLARR
jgi:hypothetical protein